MNGVLISRQRVTTDTTSAGAAVNRPIPCRGSCSAGPGHASERSHMLVEPRWLLMSVAAVVIIVAGMRAASNLLLTAMLALFITVMVSPLQRGLRRVGLPRLVSIVCVMGTVLSMLAAFGVVLARSVEDTLVTVTSHLGMIEELTAQVTRGLGRVGFDVSDEGLASMLTGGRLMETLGSLAGRVLSLITNVVFVSVMVGFMLIESSDLPRKLDLALGTHHERRRHIAEAIDRVRRYVWIKTLVSIATGVLAGVSCWLAGVEAPLLWGLIAFVLNYIPVFGSLIAAIPPVLLALGSGPLAAAGLAIAYVVINIVMAEIVEPRVLADKIGLSPAVILLSLLFWGWVFGWPGLLLAVPFTMVLYAYCDYRDELGWLAILLSSRSLIEARVETTDEGRATAVDLQARGAMSSRSAPTCLCATMLALTPAPALAAPSQLEFAAPASDVVEPRLCGFEQFSAQFRQHAQLVREQLCGLPKPNLAGSPQRAGLSLEDETMGQLSTAAQLHLGPHQLVIEHPGYAPRTVEFAPAPRVRDRLDANFYPALADTRARRMAPLGGALLGAGVVGLFTGVGLMAVHGRELAPRCGELSSPAFVDAGCRQTYDTADAGVTAVILGGVATVAGATVLAVVVPQCEQDTGCPDHELGVLLGPTRVGVGIEF